MTLDLLSSLIYDTAATITVSQFLLCTVVSIILGLIIALVYMVCNRTYQKGFVLTIAMLPMIIQIILLVVNGNLGTGVAVMGVFSLVRFRSLPGRAEEILTIFLSMAVGLITGAGYVLIAIVFVLISCLLQVLLSFSSFGGKETSANRYLQITIPESLNYEEVFTDIFDTYTTRCELTQVKTTNMGSLFKLDYQIKLKDAGREKALIDELRTRNGNLEISSSMFDPHKGERL